MTEPTAGSRRGLYKPIAGLPAQNSIFFYLSHVVTYSLSGAYRVFRASLPQAWQVDKCLPLYRFFMPLTTHSVYFENPVARLSEHRDGYALVQYKPGKRGFADFQALLTHLSHLLRRRGWDKVLSDQRALAPFTEQEQAYIRARWQETAPGSHHERLVAALLPHDVYARLSAHLVINDAHEGDVTYHIFEDEVAAGMWLRQTQ